MTEVKRLGEYRIEAELGRGGMGVVYKGYDERLSRAVAVKVMSEALANEAEVVERFMREARAMAALNHPNIVQIYHIGESNGRPWLVMEYVEGKTLGQLIRTEAPLEVAYVRSLIAQAARGLAAAHAQGVIHRDIKPGNLMLRNDGVLKVGDFGIARARQLGRTITGTGEFVGTPGYLSPEVCQGHEVQPGSDIFSLGIVMFELLTGRVPFTDESPLGLMLEVVQAQVPDVREINREVDEDTWRALCKMVAKDPKERYASCAELLKDLGEPDTALGAVPTAGHRTAATVLTSPTTAARKQPLVAGKVAEKPTSNTPMLVVAAVMIVIVGFGGFRLWQQFGAKPEQPRTMAATSTLNAASEQDADEQGSGAAEALGEAPETADEGADEGGLASDAGATTDTPAVTNELMAGAGDVDQLAETDAGDVVTGGEVASDATAIEAVASQGTDASDAALTLAARAGNEQLANDETAQIDQAAAAAAVEQAPQLAVVEPPAVKSTPTPAPTAALSGMMILAIGDPALAAPLEQRLLQAVADNDGELVDAEMADGIAPLRYDPGVPLRTVAMVAREAGAARLMVARIIPVDARPLEYYGEYTTLYTADIELRVIDLVDERVLPPRYRSRVDYTGLNAEQKANKAANEILREWRQSRQLSQRSG